MKLTKDNFAMAAKSLGYNIEPEYYFIKGRKFRADWFIELRYAKVLIEYEGVNAGKSRHTTLTGYTKDCEKYNLASVAGYVVLRYTALNFDNVFKDLESIRGK